MFVLYCTGSYWVGWGWGNVESDALFRYQEYIVMADVPTDEILGGDAGAWRVTESPRNANAVLIMTHSGEMVVQVGG